MASKVALAIKAERECQEQQKQLDRIETMLTELLGLIQNGAAKPAPTRRSSSRKKDSES